MKAKANSSKKGSKNKFLTVEFAGICALVTRKSAATPVVWLPDVLRAAPPGQGTRHFASLLVRTIEPQAEVADSTVTVPGQPPEYAMWDLSSVEVSFQSDVKSGVTTPSKPAGRRAASINRLADVWSISSPTGVSAAPPLTATVNIDSGELAAIMEPKAGQKYVFFKGTKPTATELKAASEIGWRFRVRIPFKKRISIVMRKNGKSRTLSFEQNTDAVIANLCQEVGSTRNHFYAYYGLVEGEQFVKIRVKTPKPAASKGESWPDFEYCRGSRITEA